MTKLRVVTILGTRPEIIRLSECIKACDRYFDHTLVHTGQNYDVMLNQVFFDELGLRMPDYCLEVVGDHIGQTMGNIIAKSFELMNQLKPDALLILGDTNSALCAISAKRLKIPVFHMEAGNRCFDENVPEEINRRIVDHISDVNLPYTEHSRRYLIQEGRNASRTFVTGSPMAEVLAAHTQKIDQSQILRKLRLTHKRYFIASIHREENIDLPKNFDAIMGALNEIVRVYQLPIIYSAHPRSAKQIEKRAFVFDPLIRQMQPFGFFDYVHLQKHALCVLSDSGTLGEESAMLDFAGVSLRTSTERPEALDQGKMILASIEKEQVLQAVDLALVLEENAQAKSFPKDYQDQNVSQKVVRIIQSYVPVINREVWRKS